MQVFQTNVLESDTARARFIRECTTVRAVPFCPELRLHMHSSVTALWEVLDGTGEDATGQPPYWSVPWVGGQALARYILDNRSAFDGKRVLDIGSGSGLCAIAAAYSGASHVIANDVDPLSRSAIRLNAELNNAVVDYQAIDLIEREAPDCDVILAADMWYERFLAARVTAWLRALAATGRTVLLGDIVRAHFPRSGLDELASYRIPTSEETERNSVTPARVWRLLPAAT